MTEPMTLAAAYKRTRADARELYAKEGDAMSERDIISVTAQLAHVTYDEAAAFAARYHEAAKHPAKRIPLRTAHALIKRVTFSDDVPPAYLAAIAMARNMTAGDPEGFISQNLAFIADELGRIANELAKEGF